jgi:2-polyprenyl-3-methyl-5-hydroxy-6-metoxy-1,4-benzoquinol methylase
MPDIEDIVDIARHQIIAAPTVEAASLLPKKFETETGLPPNQIRRLEAYVALRSDDAARAIEQMTACFNQDRYFGTLIDLASLYLSFEFSGPNQRDETIAALATVSHQLRLNGPGTYSLRADCVASLLLYKTPESFDVLKPVAEMWRSRAGELSYTDDEFQSFRASPYGSAAEKRFMGFVYTLAGEHALSIRVNDLFTAPLGAIQASIAPPSGDDFGSSVQGQVSYNQNPSFIRTNDNFAAILLDEESYGRVADLGCGCGLTGAKVRSRAQYIVGVDMNGPALEVANDQGIYDDLKRQDMLEFLRQDTQPYDLIMSCMGIEWFYETEDIFKLAWQRLAPGGRLAFAVVPCRDGPVRATEDLLSGLRWFSFDPDDLADQAKAIGFHVARQELHPYAYSVGAFFLLQRPG